MKKFNILRWYLKRPPYYSELIRQLSRDIIPYLKDTKKQTLIAQKWCEEHKINAEAALRTIFGQKKFENFQNTFKEQLLTSKNVEMNCPVKMGGPGHLSLIYNITEQIKATKVIETGVAYGWSSLAILLSLKNRKDSILISTDKPYPGLKNEQYVGCVIPSDLKPFWRIIRLPDRKAIPRAIEELAPFDLCHYDSDKSPEGRTWAYPCLWKALRQGGIFISDDISDNLAFHDFCTSLRQEPLIIKDGQKYIGILRKE